MCQKIHHFAENGEPGSRKRFIFLSFINILWQFVFLQGVAVLLLLNVSLLFPRVLPEGHIFVLDSAEYIEDLYYYGSGPQEIKEQDLQKQWYQANSEVS